MKESDTKTIRHIAFIMDGNGRWAKKRLLNRNFGHREGVKTVSRVIDYSIKYAVPTLTLYAFSTENWNRPQKEIDGLFSLIGEFFEKSEKKFIDKGVRVRVLGSRENISEDLKTKISKIERVTEHLTILSLNICFNYGSREEIISAIKDMVNRGAEICESELEKSLYTHDICDPDLIVRTSGEKRLSNFLLYQSAYSEMYFTDCLWPDFSENDFASCIEEYEGRSRRFGGVGK